MHMRHTLSILKAVTLLSRRTVYRLFDALHELNVPVYDESDGKRPGNPTLANRIAS